MAKKQDLARQLAETGLGRRPPSSAPPPDDAGSSPRGDAEADDDGEHVRTGAGYRKKDGTALVRTSVMFTREERRWLKRQAEDAGLSTSDYVRRALGLDVE